MRFMGNSEPLIKGFMIHTAVPGPNSCGRGETHANQDTNLIKMVGTLQSYSLACSGTATGKSGLGVWCQYAGYEKAMDVR